VLEAKSTSGVPLYYQLRNILREKIMSGEFHSDERIPPEVELCRQYGVSRITVRKAIEALVLDNLLYTKQGTGTFVTPQKLRRRLPRLYSFTEDMKELGLNPTSTIVEFELTAAEPQDAKLLKLPEHDRNVFKLVRVRRANDEPILLETTFIPHYLCPELLSANLERDSLYRVLRDQYNLTLHDAEETYEVGIVGTNEAKLLEYRRNQPVFHIRRLANLADGAPFELTRSVGRGDYLQFSLHLITNQAEFRRHVEVQREEA